MPQPEPVQLSASNKPPVVLQPAAFGSEAESVSVENDRMHDILGSEALAAALREANDGHPVRGGGSSAPRSSPGAHLAHMAATQQREPPVVGMVMTLPSPPPVFLSAGQAANHWTTDSHADDDGIVAQAADNDDEGSLLNLSGDDEPRPMFAAALSECACESSTITEGADGGFPGGAAAMARGGPVYLEQPDGSVQLALLVNPLYRPPPEAEDDGHEIPLYQATVDETYQVRILVSTCSSPISPHLL